MALSAVYRTGQRFGVNHLIDVLRGAENDRIFQFDHHLLPVHGIGRSIDSNQWRSVFRDLVARNYLSIALDRFGELRLEESCRALLKGEDSIALRYDVIIKEAKAKTRSTCRKSSAGKTSFQLDPLLWAAV